MSKLDTMKWLWKNNRHGFITAAWAKVTKTGIFDKMPDEKYLRLSYWMHMGKRLDLDNPITYNEKLQWLKLHDRKPRYTMLVDKYEVREHIKQVLGEEYLIPLLGVWESADDIDFESLPNQFVIKCTHDSKSVIICKDKSKFDKEEARKKMRNALKRNMFYWSREWPYKDCKPRVIAEKYMEDSNGELRDYKFFCFNGKCDNVMVVAGRVLDNWKFYHFDKKGKLLHYNRLCRSLPDDFTIPMPENIDEMFAIAERLSIGLPEIRLDLYNVDGKIYFGEYTFFNESGYETGFDYETDKHLGDLIVLPK